MENSTPTSHYHFMILHLATICNKCPKSYNDDQAHLRCEYFKNEYLINKIRTAAPFCPLLYHTFGVPRTSRLKHELQFYISGIVKRAISILGLCKASEEFITKRLDICYSCEELESSRCRKCGCPVKHKTRIAHESCPIGKWVADPSVSCKVVSFFVRLGLLPKRSIMPPPSFVKLSNATAFILKKWNAITFRFW